jgi:phosphate transport system substrate-binding protein
MNRKAAGWSALGVAALMGCSAGWSATQAEDRFTLGAGLTIRADRIEKDERGLRIYLPSLPSEPIVVTPQLAQIIGLQNARAAAAGVMQAAIHGSNTIGSELMVNLIKAYANSKEADMVSSATGEDELMIEIKRRGTDAPSATIELHAKGSATAFIDLAAHRADIGMASRAIKKEEIDQGRAAQLGDLKAQGEKFLGLDGVTVIINRNNPISALPLDKLALMFGGELRDWAQVDQQNRISGPIRVYARDEKSGTFDTFKSLVLDPAKKVIHATERFEDSDKLVEKVASDPLGIGFIGLSYAEKGEVKKVALVSECGLPSTATTFSIKTEEYPLARRLFLYTPTPQNNRLAQDLLDFVKTSPDTQRVISETGFVNADIEFERFDNQAQRFAQLAFLPNQNLQDVRAFIDDVRFAKRASRTFHFITGSADLDPKGVEDVGLLARELMSPTFGERRFLIVGFASDKEGNRDAVKRLSELRAKTVAQMLREQGAKNVFQDNARGYGSAAPVSCNPERNQRVEVWLQD